ncbi:hypothetical protein BJX63DRAFT_116104 [Aspergillus granulosus]|uniref:Uncharacterized protein n=1 Tax=Aspergillus granulosus TaxID=176169 RepID=A0ABR4GTH7_9EURO
MCFRIRSAVPLGPIQRCLGSGFASQEVGLFKDLLSLASMCFSASWIHAYVTGLYVCPGGARNGTCSQGSVSFYPNITTTFSVFNRKASFVASRSNMTILSVSSLDTPTQDPSFDLEAYRAAIGWILDFNSAIIPPPTAVAANFWNGQTQLGNTYWSGELRQMFQSILVFPLRMFNANGIGNIDEDWGRISENLPPEFYSTASIATPHSRIIINTAMFSVFILLQAVLHLFIWAVFAWLWVKRPALPVITSYPLFDFAFKTRYKGRSQAIPKEQPTRLPSGLLRANDADVLSILQGGRHFLRTEDERLGLLTCQSRKQAPGSDTSSRI